MVKVKICGITNSEDAEFAIQSGADALGFVFYEQSPRSVDRETVRSIALSLPPFITTVGVFVNEDPENIKEIASYTGLDVIQLHGSEPPEHCTLHRKVIKAIRVKELADLSLLDRYRSASAFLLDTYSAKSYGGSGRTFNWEIAVEAKKHGNIILAGGLNPENITEAIQFVKPYAVDVSSGVEHNKKGNKDHNKLRLFIERAREASL
jgi:phosphoribosylanthranilate isomerase